MTRTAPGISVPVDYIILRDSSAVYAVDDQSQQRRLSMLHAHTRVPMQDRAGKYSAQKSTQSAVLLQCYYSNNAPSLPLLLWTTEGCHEQPQLLHTYTTPNATTMAVNGGRFRQKRNSSTIVSSTHTTRHEFHTTASSHHSLCSFSCSMPCHPPSLTIP